MSTQTQEKKETVYTVENLRRKGYKVEITHLRKTKGKHPRLLEKREIENRNDINPKGGATKAVITTPEKVEVEATVNCFWRDAYCKNTGITTSLERAFEILKDS
jgi:hypothetical protein